MALLGASFQIGRSALAAYQSAISVVGQNIANVGNPDYTRQSGRLAALVGGPTIGGVAPGGGVRLDQLQRHLDQGVESRLRMAYGSAGGAQIVWQNLSQVEQMYNELTTTDLSTQLSEFFASFGQLETDPQDAGARNIIVGNAGAVVDTIRRQRTSLVQQAEDLNINVTAVTRRANELASGIADLNHQIVLAESDGQTVASALRDQRDGLLRELGGLMDIQVREQERGATNVFIGSEPLVEFGVSRGLTVETVLEDGLEKASVRFADNHGNVIIRDGQLAGLLAARDEHLVGQLQRIDSLARGLIYEVNKVHATGVGLVGNTSMTGAYAVTNRNLALNAPEAGVQFPIQNGTFIVHVRNPDSGQVITRQIEIDLDGLNGDDTTLASLAGDLEGVPGLKASVTADGKLSVSAEGSNDFWFTEDSSGALAALGMNAFFTGANGKDIAVNNVIANDPRRISASLTGDVNDGANAGTMSLLAARTSTSTLLDGLSIEDYHRTTVERLATVTSAAASAYEAADSVHASLVSQREAISGVSLDEESVKLMQYERAYQGAARYVSVLDNLTNEMLALIG